MRFSTRNSLTANYARKEGKKGNEGVTSVPSHSKLVTSKRPMSKVASSSGNANARGALKLHSERRNAWFGTSCCQQGCSPHPAEQSMRRECPGTAFAYLELIAL